MTRRGIIAALAGAVGMLKGQQPSLEIARSPSDMTALSVDFTGAAVGMEVRGDGRTVKLSVKEIMDALAPFQNGRCPNCGLQAEAWKKEMAIAYDHYEPAPLPTDPPGTASRFQGIGPYLVPKDFGPLERPIRCKRCSCLFGQDAEEGREQ